jgi:DNA-binding transcriptional LysR family regulator
LPSIFAYQTSRIGAHSNPANLDSVYATVDTVFLQPCSKFFCITREGSITGARRQPELPNSNVSLRLRQLEEQLGIRLIQRTTRVLKLTKQGKPLHQHCQKILTAGDTATRVMQGFQDGDD